MLHVVVLRYQVCSRNTLSFLFHCDCNWNLLIAILGKLYGRGATDDKGPVAGWLNALEAFQKTNQVLQPRLTTWLHQNDTKQGCFLLERPVEITDHWDMRKQGLPKPVYQHSAIRYKVIGLFSSFRNCNCFTVTQRS